MRRVLIIGSSGAGKSTLARRLAPHLGLPVIHLDRHYWKPGWQPTPEAEWRDCVSQLVKGDTWIMDGNYSGTLDLRFPAADTIIDLDFPTALCLARVFKRHWMYPRRGRPDMADGCPERRFNLSFYHWVLFFRKTSRPRIERAYEAYGEGKTVLRFKKPAELERWLAEMFER